MPRAAAESFLGVSLRAVPSVHVLVWVDAFVQQQLALLRVLLIRCSYAKVVRLVGSYKLVKRCQEELIAVVIAQLAKGE